MNKLLQKGLVLVFIIFFNATNVYSGGSDKWNTVAQYEKVPDSLSRYGAVNLFYKETIQFQLEDFKIKTIHTIHQKTKIISIDNIKQYSTFYFPNAKPDDKIRARTIKSDGNVINLKRSDIKFNENKSGSISGSLRNNYGEFVIPGLEAGDEIEIYYSITTPAVFVVNDFFFHQKTYTIKTEYSVIRPYDLRIEYKTYNKSPEVKIYKEGDFQVYSWSMQNLLPFKAIKVNVIYDSLPFVRIALRSVDNKDHQSMKIPSTWYDFMSNFWTFDKHATQKGSSDMRLNAFLDSLLGKETYFLTSEKKIELFAKAHEYVNEHIELFFPKDSSEMKGRLGDYIAMRKIPYYSVASLYEKMLVHLDFEYYHCLGRNRVSGPLDAEFMTINQPNEFFFSFRFGASYYFVFPKTYYSKYHFGETPNFLEGTKSIMVSWKDYSGMYETFNVQKTNLTTNTKTIRIMSSIILDDNQTKECSKLVTTGALSPLYRNAFKYYRKDSIESNDIFKILFQTRKEDTDSMSIQEDQSDFPFRFSLKYNTLEKNFISDLGDNNRNIQLRDLIRYPSYADYYKTDDNDVQRNIRPFAFNERILYYMLFDKDVKYMEQESNQITFENQAGSYDLKITQLNPRTILITSQLNCNNENWEPSPSDPFNEVLKNMEGSKNINLSFSIVQ